MSEAWTDRLAGARMQVDRQFNERVLESAFTNQEWGLIMTAVEFDIDSPDSPEDAELVANTDNVPDMLPHLDEMQGGGMGGPPGPADRDESSSGVVGRLGRYLKELTANTDDGVDDETLTEATALVEEYTSELQAFLERENQWEQLCELAAQSQSRQSQS